MTCVNCQYQWCWLCEGEYKYGHYDRGNCKGKQFLEFKNINAFGLHKLFPCICPKNIIPHDDDNKLEIYIVILIIWLFGVFIISGMFLTYVDEKFFKDESLSCIFRLFFLVYFFAFQIPFTFLTTPFILICIIYPKFIGRFVYFFGIGKNLENE